MRWKPSNEPARYNPKRVASFEPVSDAIGKLGLPLIRFRKLNGICNAIAMQIEDGGDSPEVNDLLLNALRAAVLHQVGQQAAAVLQAIEAFRKGEAERWKLIRSGVPLPVTPEERLDDLVEEGYDALEQKDTRTACDRWLAAWEIARQLARPEIRTANALSAHYGLGYSAGEWTQELMFELYNAGLDDPRYNERRLRFVREFLALFPDEDAHSQLNFLRGEGEALWALGRRAEAEAAYAALVERFPDEGEAYFGWADQYWLWTKGPKEYEPAEAIMQRALARPHLQDRDVVLDRLRRLYTESGQPEKLAQLPRDGAPEPLRLTIPAAAAPPPRPTGPAAKLGRNDPCWCGSGKKYKKCHLQADRA